MNSMQILDQAAVDAADGYIPGGRIVSGVVFPARYLHLGKNVVVENGVSFADVDSLHVEPGCILEPQRGWPVVPHIDAKIKALLEGGHYRLDMGEWHQCGTTHCRAGFAILLAGEAGARLEKQYGPGCAGAMIYAASRPGVPLPDFYCFTDKAWDDIVECAKLDPLPAP